jgi:hypothetical protein
VTLGLALDADGFPKRSDIFDGNVSEAGTLEGMIMRGDSIIEGMLATKSYG